MTAANVFDRKVDALVGREGGYVNHPSDRGGETIWGITIATARRYGYAGPMRTMPRAEAVRIYRVRFWIEPQFDRIALISDAVAEELFDTGVNMGQSIAAEMLQRSLNALNRQGRDFADVRVDGEAFGLTRAALTAFLKTRGAEGERVLLKALNSLQGARYISLAEGRTANEDFVYGWLRTRVELAA